MIEVVTAISLWELIKYAGSWLTNLKRAKDSRKQASVDALRKVVVAVRRTSVYTRQLRDTRQNCHQSEAELSVLWTELSYALDDLGLDKLAKRCRIKGKQWADPYKMDLEYLEKAEVGLEKIEQLAVELLKQINN